MYTTCGNCKFAQFENNKQVGCKLDRLETWENLGNLETRQDGELVYHIIQDRKCNGWNPHEEVPIEEARRIMAIDYTIVLDYYDGIESKIEEINNFRIKPKSINIICHDDGPLIYLKLHKLSKVPLEVKEYREKHHLAKKDVMMRCKTMFVMDGADNEFVELVEKIYNYDLTHFVAIVGKYTCLDVRIYKHLEEDILNHELCLNL